MDMHAGPCYICPEGFPVAGMEFDIVTMNYVINSTPTIFQVDNGPQTRSLGEIYVTAIRNYYTAIEMR